MQNIFLKSIKILNKFSKLNEDICEKKTFEKILILREYIKEKV